MGVKRALLRELESAPWGEIRKLDHRMVFANKKGTGEIQKKNDPSARTAYGKVT